MINNTIEELIQTQSEQNQYMNKHDLKQPILLAQSIMNNLQKDMEKAIYKAMMEMHSPIFRYDGKLSNHPFDNLNLFDAASQGIFNTRYSDVGEENLTPATDSNSFGNISMPKNIYDDSVKIDASEIECLDSKLCENSTTKNHDLSGIMLSDKDKINTGNKSLEGDANKFTYESSNSSNNVSHSKDKSQGKIMSLQSNASKFDDTFYENIDEHDMYYTTDNLSNDKNTAINDQVDDTSDSNLTELTLNIFTKNDSYKEKHYTTHSNQIETTTLQFYQSSGPTPFENENSTSKNNDINEVPLSDKGIINIGNKSLEVDAIKFKSELAISSNDASHSKNESQSNPIVLQSNSSKFKDNIPENNDEHDMYYFMDNLSLDENTTIKNQADDTFGSNLTESHSNIFTKPESYKEKHDALHSNQIETTTLQFYQSNESTTTENTSRKNETDLAYKVEKHDTADNERFYESISSMFQSTEKIFLNPKNKYESEDSLLYLDASELQYYDSYNNNRDKLYEYFYDDSTVPSTKFTNEFDKNHRETQNVSTISIRNDTVIPERNITNSQQPHLAMSSMVDDTNENEIANKNNNTAYVRVVNSDENETNNRVSANEIVLVENNLTTSTESVKIKTSNVENESNLIFSDTSSSVKTNDTVFNDFTNLKSTEVPAQSTSDKTSSLDAEKNAGIVKSNAQIEENLNMNDELLSILYDEAEPFNFEKTSNLRFSSDLHSQIEIPTDKYILRSNLFDLVEAEINHENLKPFVEEDLAPNFNTISSPETIAANEKIYYNPRDEMASNYGIVKSSESKPATNFFGKQNNSLYEGLSDKDVILSIVSSNKKDKIENNNIGNSLIKLHKQFVNQVEDTISGNLEDYYYYDYYSDSPRSLRYDRREGKSSGSEPKRYDDDKHGPGELFATEKPNAGLLHDISNIINNLVADFHGVELPEISNKVPEIDYYDMNTFISNSSNRMEVMKLIDQRVVDIISKNADVRINPHETIVYNKGEEKIIPYLDPIDFKTYVTHMPIDYNGTEAVTNKTLGDKLEEYPSNFSKKPDLPTSFIYDYSENELEYDEFDYQDMMEKKKKNEDLSHLNVYAHNKDDLANKDEIYDTAGNSSFYENFPSIFQAHEKIILPTEEKYGSEDSLLYLDSVESKTYSNDSYKNNGITLNETSHDDSTLSAPSFTNKFDTIHRATENFSTISIRNDTFIPDRNISKPVMNILNEIINLYQSVLDTKISSTIPVENENKGE